MPVSALVSARRLALAAGLVLAGSSTFAALPPEYQRLEELKAIIAAADAEGIAAIVGEITAIEFIVSDYYEIRSATCVVAALIVTPPQKGPPLIGPRQFEVHLQPAVCR